MKGPPSEQSLRDLPLECIVGVVHLGDCINDSKSKRAISGDWHWVLEGAFVKPSRMYRASGTVDSLGWRHKEAPEMTQMKVLLLGIVHGVQEIPRGLREPREERKRKSLELRLRQLVEGRRVDFTGERHTPIGIRSPNKLRSTWVFGGNR
jgi:hypothetical protein